MAEFSCPKHGNVGTDVLNTHVLMQAAHVIDKRVITDPLGSTPKAEYICARCAAQMIDAAFLPLRRK
jgi:hypothetical protein